MNTRHPVTQRLAFEDHRAMAAFWGEEAIKSLREAIANPRYVTREDLALFHAVRAARIAWWHALKIGGRHRGGL